MAKKQRSLQCDRYMSSGMPVATSSIAPSAVSPPFKTCSKCRSLFKNDGNMSIHTTLAYSRCRCHRYFKFSLQQRQLGLSHGMWLDSQGTISATADRGMHQFENGKGHGCKQRSKYITAVHSSNDREPPHCTELPPITLSQKSVAGFSSRCEPNNNNRSAEKALLHGNSHETSTSKLPLLAW